MFQVLLGNCGDPVSYYIVEWDTSDSFNSAALSSVTLDGDSLLVEQQVRHTICCLTPVSYTHLTLPTICSV